MAHGHAAEGQVPLVAEAEVHAKVYTLAYELDEVSLISKPTTMIFDLCRMVVISSMMR